MIYLQRDKSFFEPFKEHYDVVFLDDFKEQIKGINTNFYGMLDQLIASKGRVFIGTWWSTLSGYVNRMRGYYIAKHKLDGYKDGSMESYYFYPVSDFVLLPSEFFLITETELGVIFTISSYILGRTRE